MLYGVGVLPGTAFSGDVLLASNRPQPYGVDPVAHLQSAMQIGYTPVYVYYIIHVHVL